MLWRWWQICLKVSPIYTICTSYIGGIKLTPPWQLAFPVSHGIRLHLMPEALSELTMRTQMDLSAVKCLEPV